MAQDRQTPPEEARVAVVVNGNAKAVSDQLVEVLDQIVQSGDLFVSRSLAEGQRIAEQIVTSGYHTVLTGGGDGTFTQMVTWVVGASERANVEPPRFGMLKLGTGNALAWVLGAQQGVVADLSRLRREGGSREIRLVEVESILTPFAGCGLEATALQHFHEARDVIRKIPVVRKFGQGGLSYLLGVGGKTVPKSLFDGQFRVKVLNLGEGALRLGDNGLADAVEVPVGQVLYAGTARGVWASTVPYWGFGARIFPFADERPDRFNLRVVDVNAADVVLNIRSIWKGTYRSSRVSDFLVDKVRLVFESPVPMEIGGDPYGERSSVEMSLSRSIRVVDYYAPPPVDES